MDQEIVIDAAIDDIHALRAAGGAHVEHVIAHEQVLALDQFHAHLLGEEGMLEVGAVEGARCQHDYGRIGHRAVGHAAQIVEQHVRVVADRFDGLLGEELGEQAHHHAAVLDHVRHTRRHPQVVLEDPV